MVGRLRESVCTQRRARPGKEKKITHQVQEQPQGGWLKREGIDMELDWNLELAFKTKEGKQAIATAKEIETSLFECLTDDELEELINDIKRILESR
jgi:hypothetical protein